MRVCLLARLPCPGETVGTLTHSTAVRRSLAEVRLRGIAHDDCEVADELCCVALPVRDFAWRCIAAIGISGPVWRMATPAMDEKVAHLHTAAAALSARLGFAGE